MNNIFGFSTGCLYKLNLTTNEIISIYLEMGFTKIEIGYVSSEKLKLDPIKNIDAELLEKFDYVSFHAPGSHFKYSDNKETDDFFADLIELNKRVNLDLIVFHPDSFEDLRILNLLPLPIGIENMDVRKSSFLYPGEIGYALNENPGWGMVLDTQHCYTLDTTMDLADQFIDEFLPRIKQVHLSGYTDYHHPLFKTKQDIIIDKSLISQPIIVESVLDSIDDLIKENEYIKNYMKIN